MYSIIHTDARLDPATCAPPVPAPAAPVAEANVVGVVDEKPKFDPEAGDVDVAVVAVVIGDVMWEGNPNKKPTLPAFGGVDPLLLSGGATLNLNDAGVVDAAELLAS